MTRGEAQFKHMVLLHSNRSNRNVTPFISVTSSPVVASSDATSMQASGNQTDVMVALIDTVALLGSCRVTVWDMHHAMDHFGLRVPNSDRRLFDEEYICALRIPASAIFACCRPEYFLKMSLILLKSLERRD